MTRFASLHGDAATIDGDGGVRGQPRDLLLGLTRHQLRRERRDTTTRARDRAPHAHRATLHAFTQRSDTAERLSRDTAGRVSEVGAPKEEGKRFTGLR
eukprot:6190419-Pleurochrysis_carterae.AAC.5